MLQVVSATLMVGVSATLVIAMIFAIGDQSLRVLDRVLGGDRSSTLPPPSRRLSADPEGEASPLLTFWFGLSLLILCLQLWHLLLPIDGRAGVVFAALGGLSLVLGAWRPLVRSINTHRGASIIVLLACLWVANRAIGVGDAHDSGLYHYTVVRWLNEHAIVPGLANLAGPFALNNAHLLYGALLNTGPWHGRFEHLMNAAIVMSVLGASLRGVFHVLRAAKLRARGSNALTTAEQSTTQPETTQALALSVYWASMLPMLIYLALSKDISSPKTDPGPNLGVLVLGSALFALLLAPRSASPQTLRRLLIQITTIASACVCMKLGTGMFSLTAWLIGAWVYWSRTRSTNEPAPRALALCVLISTLLIAPWIGRNLVLSGYPLFPSGVLAAPVDWRFPEAPRKELSDVISNHVKGELSLWLQPKMAELTRGTPAAFYADLMKPPFDDRMQIRGYEWLRSWLFTLPVSSPIEIVMPVGLGLMALLAIAWLTRARGGSPTRGERSLQRTLLSPVLIALVLPATLSLAFWFFTAPGPRYGWPFAWVLYAAAAIALVLGAARANARFLRLVPIVGVLCIVPALAYRAITIRLIGSGSLLTQIPFQSPGPDHGFHPTPSRPLKVVTTRWGLEVFVPEGKEELCWDGPLPNVAWPPLDMNLRARRPGDLGAGFCIDWSEKP